MSAHGITLLILDLALIIILAQVGGKVARMLGQPPVVGEIAAGILLGPTLFGDVIMNAFFPAEVRIGLTPLANLGVILFMFLVGYELDHQLVTGRKRVAVSVSLGSIILPLGLGALLALWLAKNHDVPRVLPFALFIGAAMSVTAFPVLARILTDRNMCKTSVGGLALACAAVDDVAAWSMLAAVVALASANGFSWHLTMALPYLLVMFLIVRPLLRRLGEYRDRVGRITPAMLGIVVIGLLLSCFAAEWMGIHAIFGAFLFGVVMPRSRGKALREDIVTRLEQVSMLVLLPVFFVLAGLRVNLSTVDTTGWVELALILVVAIVGKFVGAYAGARVQGVNKRHAGALAALMNTRGLTEIVILTVGLQLGILDGSLFSLMVVMALVTTAMAGPLLSVIYPKRLVDQELAEYKDAEQENELAIHRKEKTDSQPAARPDEAVVGTGRSTHREESPTARAA